jgi:hypothetical protein
VTVELSQNGNKLPGQYVLKETANIAQSLLWLAQGM